MTFDIGSFFVMIHPGNFDCKIMTTNKKLANMGQGMFIIIETKNKMGQGWWACSGKKRLSNDMLRNSCRGILLRYYEYLSVRDEKNRVIK